MKVLSVVGARPQFIKAAAVSQQLRDEHTECLVHTGQHYDTELSAVFFDDLDLAEPAYHLDVGSGTHAQQTAPLLIEIERLIHQETPDVVLVYGDTNSTLAGAIAAAKTDPPLAHVEAGLRAGNPSMPEEVNRILTDHCADFLFAPSDRSKHRLASEGLTDGVVVSGDVMYDTLVAVRERVESHPVDGIDIPDEFVLATVHRAGNTDNRDRLAAIVDGLARLPEPVLFPAHPRTVEALHEYGLWERATEVIDIVDPVGYLTFIRLIIEARCVATDSGGVQKEAVYLETPCVTLRETTEWTETVEAGWNVLVGADADRIVNAVSTASPPPAKPELYGGGRAADRIVTHLEQQVETQ